MSKLYLVKMSNGDVWIHEHIDGDLETEIMRTAALQDEPLTIVSTTETTLADIPADHRVLRKALDVVNGQLTWNPDRCQDLIRAKRNEKLAELDTRAFQELRKPGGDVTEIDQLAQTLRDIPQADTRFINKDIEGMKQIILELDEI